MPVKFVFNSSLPRSGSTLFSNIIAQNPDFHVTPTSGLLDLLYVARHQFTNAIETKAQDSSLMDAAFLGFCRGAMTGYAQASTDKPWFVDKCRGWAIHYSFLNSIIPSPKIVCLVRDPLDIFCSMEKLFRASTIRDPLIVNHSELRNTTVEKRIDFWMKSPPVGLALERLHEIIRYEIIDQLLVLRYEQLCADPSGAIRQFYDYIEAPHYSLHSFSNISQQTVENDSLHGIFGDHTIRPVIEDKPSDALHYFGPITCEYIRESYSWYYDFFGK